MSEHRHIADMMVNELPGEMRMDRAWTIQSILRRMADGLDHLLDDHSCDAHGHEELNECRKLAREVADSIDSALMKKGVDGTQEKEILFLMKDLFDCLKRHPDCISNCKAGRGLYDRAALIISKEGDSDETNN